jgi:hypothetical protein
MIPDYVKKLVEIYSKLSEEQKEVLFLMYQDIESGKEVRTKEEYLKEVRAGK